MTQDQASRHLPMALRIIGIIYIIGVPAMMMVIWPSGWGWTPPQPEYEHMIMGVYATLGLFLYRAATDPLAHASLIWFTIWSNIVHGTIMLYYALVDETDRMNLIGDVPALYIVAFVLWRLMPEKTRYLG